MAKRPSPPAKRTNIFQAAKPKGINPGPIPRTAPYRDRPRAEPDEEELAAVAPYRDVPDAEGRRNRQVSRAALAQGNLSPAKARQLGIILSPDDDEQGRTLDEMGEEQYDEPPPEPRASRGRGAHAATEEADDIAAWAALPPKALAEELTQSMGPSPRDLQRAREAASREMHEPPRQPQPMQPSPMEGASPIIHPVDAYYLGKESDIQPAAAARSNGAIHHASGLASHPLRVGDIDRLWDWIRQDKQNEVTLFLGRNFATSVELHQFLWQIAAVESKGIAIIRALYWGETHFGFAMLAPILAQERTALMHLYLAPANPAARGSLFQIAGPLIDVATRTLPGVHLAVSSLDQQWAKLHRAVLAPLGFIEHTMFVR